MKDISILFVDDEKRILASLERNLQREPYNKFFAESASEALKILAYVPIHVVVSDLKMPGTDGLKFLKKVKDLYPDTVRVVLTGFIQVNQIVPCINTGEIYRYVTKPIEPREFKQTLLSAINYYLLQRDRQDLIERLEQRNRELEKALEELKQKETHLLRLSLLDELTNIPNRRNFNRIIIREWQRARRNRTPLSLIMLDLDDFAEFNNTYGHQAGDICLRDVARTMQNTLKRPGDMIARYGGEEFAVVLPETPLNGAHKVAEEIRARIEGLQIPHAYSGNIPVVTVSAGVASLVPDESSCLNYKNLVEFSDKQLYIAKRNGKNRVTVLKENLIHTVTPTDKTGGKVLHTSANSKDKVIH